MTLPKRCAWCGDDPLYVAYHDEEWGRPLQDARALWECLVLEGFQAGLSWITILRRREGFREAFRGFNPQEIALWQQDEVERLLKDARIIRHRGKIEACIAGAQAFLRIEARQGFSRFLWDHVGGAPILPQRSPGTPPAVDSPEARALAKALKAEGFKFCGPTITYAFMQAVGMVNDHAADCDWRWRAA